MEEEVKISFWKKFKISIFGLEDYKKLVVQKTSKTISYIVILMLIFTFFLTLAITYSFSGTVNKVKQYIDQNIETLNFNNGKILEIVQKKRTHKISIPLLPVTLEILEKYNFQVPKIRENTMLKYIKEAGQKAGIIGKHIVTEDRGSKITNTTYYKYELIGTHTGRRSFISNMLKCGYDGHILMKITGHKTEASFKKYAKLSSEDAANVILDGEARKEESKEKQTNQPVTKSKIDVLDYLFAEDSLLRLDELQNKGIDIYDLTELKEAINVIKDTKRTDKPKKFLAGFDKSTLFTRIDKLDGIIWDIARRCFDFTLYQVFQQKVIELGLSERIKEVMDRDEIDGFWYQEYSLGKLEEENGF